MPHVTVRGIPEETLAKISHPLKDVVVKAADTNPDYVKIFYSPVKRVDEPEEVAVDVYWMHRPQELCDQVSTAVTEFMHRQGHEFVQVTFTEFPGNLFYENDVHY